jgi:hypothetical protein
LVPDTAIAKIICDSRIEHSRFLEAADTYVDHTVSRLPTAHYNIVSCLPQYPLRKRGEHVVEEDNAVVGTHLGLSVVDVDTRKRQLFRETRYVNCMMLSRPHVAFPLGSEIVRRRTVPHDSSGLHRIWLAAEVRFCRVRTWFLPSLNTANFHLWRQFRSGRERKIWLIGELTPHLTVDIHDVHVQRYCSKAEQFNGGPA